MTEWTVDTLREHWDALRVADQRALQIKETADGRALQLQAETQKYKDEKANELRSQIERERGTYVTNDKFDTALKPLQDYVSAQQGRQQGIEVSAGALVAAASVLSAVVAIIVLVAT